MTATHVHRLCAKLGDVMRRVPSLAVIAAVAALVLTANGARASTATAAAQSSPPGLPVTVSVDTARQGAPVNQALVGINHPVAGAGSAMRAIGVRWARVDTYFDGSVNGLPSYDCATGAWNPTALDQRVALARDEGATPLVIADYTPACLASNAPPGTNPSYSPPDVGPDRSKWDHAVAQMALHEITAEGVRAFEIWNEPDGTFWTGGLAAYLQLYADTAQVIEQAAAAARVPIEVGGPALLFPDASWIEPMLATVVAQHLPLDFLSWHYYADYPAIGPIGPVPSPPPGTPPVWYNPGLRAQTYGAQVGEVRAEVAKYPTLHPALWLDEWNADAGYDPRQDGPFDAALVAAVLDSVQSAGLDRMAFFFVADDASDPAGNWGLLTAKLRPKPVYSAFSFWHAMAAAQLPVSLSPDQSASDAVGRVGAVAAASPNGTVTVLVYNFVPYDPTGGYGTVDPTPYDHETVVDLQHLRPGPYTWSRSIVDADHPGTVADHGTVGGPAASLSFSLAGEGVTLLTLVPAATAIVAPSPSATPATVTGQLPATVTGQLPATGADTGALLVAGLLLAALALAARRLAGASRLPAPKPRP